ncbi:unnamed protein product [Caenorhabditis angaria]|uniref:Serpentine receptor class gamma n=1 Tax=Caenorhabditis angaria TaxID=860376 RepID=A0A9P1IS76_9PELO|nr:unnamed protein product [Caenorhabditis angaria]
MDLLTNFKFMITLFYGVTSVALYATVTTFIFAKNNANFKGSFFKLFAVGFFMNIWTYGNSFVTLRVPQNTPKTGYFAQFFWEHNRTNLDVRFPLSFFHMFHFHFAYTQYLFNALMCWNRAMVVFFPLKSENFWRRYLIPIVLILFLTPFLTTSQIFLHHSYYEYSVDSDYFSINTTYGKASIYKYLMPTLIILTVLNIVINVMTFIRMVCMNTYGHRILEMNLLIMSFCVFLVDFFLSALSVFNYLVSNSMSTLELFWETDTIKYYNVRTQILTPFASDFLTFSHPWLLVIFSRQIREKLLQFICCCIVKKKNGSGTGTGTVMVKRGSRSAWD